MEEIKPAKPTRKPKSSKLVAETAPAELELAAQAQEIAAKPVTQLIQETTSSAVELAASKPPEIIPTAPKAETAPKVQPPAPLAKLPSDWRQAWGLPVVEGKTARELAEEAQTQLQKASHTELKTKVASETGPAKQEKMEEAPASNPLKEPVESVGSFTETDNPVGAETAGTFKSFLIPYVLLMLRDGAIHGYAIWERLMLMSIPGLNENDRVNIYRALRQLEKEGKIKSQWETTGTGPARRVYMLTNTGENFLKIWATGLRQYRQSLDFFFNLYTGGTLPNLFGNGLFTAAERKSEGAK